jgi:hypothetical protein
MNWTKKTPTEEGWYWFKDGIEDIVPVFVMKPFRGDLWSLHHPHWTYGRHLDMYAGCLWCGPIQPPPVD